MKHYYQFVVIDPSVEYSEEYINDLFINGDEEVDCLIYTRCPANGSVIYNDNIGVYDAPYVCTTLITHNNRLHISKNNDPIGKNKSFKNREEVVQFFNDTIKELLKPSSYKIIGDGEMTIHPDVINDIGCYMQVKDEETGKYKISPYLERHLHNGRVIHKMFIKDNTQIYK